MSQAVRRVEVAARELAHDRWVQKVCVRIQQFFSYWVSSCSLTTSVVTSRDYMCGNRQESFRFMGRSNLQITEAEWDVMQAVWQADEQAAGEIIARVQQTRDWNHRTIRTLVTRLIEKRAIAVRVEGGKHLYRSLVSKEECVRSASKSFSERFFSGDVKSLLMHFVENEEISEQELEDIRQLLMSKQPARKGKRSKEG